MQFKSELAKQVFQAKYMRKEHKTPDDALESLARAVGSIWPELYEETKEYVGKLWFLPGGSVWRAAGNPNRNVSYVNCTTLEPPEDNLESIFDRMYKWAKCAAFGQGNGLDISNLRPAGSVLKNSAVTSTGAVSMAPMYNAVLSVIAQQGRRGASLISIKINHPDVEKFITAKADSKALETANISIQVTDDFMVAVRDNLEYELTFTSPYETITKKINARELFRKIAEQAWKSAEPGLQFFETARKMSNSDALGYPIVSTNACFRGDTLIAVADGRNAVSIKELAEKGMDVPVYSLNKETGKVEIKWGRNPRVTGTNKRLVKVTLDDDSTLFVTEDHKFITNDGREINTIELKKGDSLPRFNKYITSIVKNKKKYYRINADTTDPRKDAFFEHRMIAKFYNEDRWNTLYNEEHSSGWVNGGLVVHHKDFDGLNNKIENLEILTFKEHREIHNVLSNNMSGKNNPMYGKKHKESTKRLIGEKTHARFQNEEYKNHIVNNLKDWWKNHPEANDAQSKVARDRYLAWCEDFIKATDLETLFIDGFLYVKKYCEHCGKEFTRPVHQRNIAYCSASCSQKEKDTTKYHSTLEEKSKRNQYHQIMVFKDLQESLKRIPFKKEWEEECRKRLIPIRFQKETPNSYIMSGYKELKEIAKNYNHRVSSVEITDIYEDVYNITVDDNHTVAIVTNSKEGHQTGVYVMQCGEQYLDSYNVCNLSHINLAKFDEYGVEGYKRLIKFGIKFINATRMLELQEHRSPLQEQAHKQSILPRSGLGVTGLADYFIKKKLEYGSDESIEETKWLFSTLAHYSYLTSYELGKEYGSFPTYDKKRIKESQFIQNMLAEGVIEDWMLDHQFNVCLNTVAPVGTGTLISDTSGSGIEPIFSLFMVRKERATTGDWKEWFIFSPIVKEYLQERNYPETPDSLKYLKESYWSTSYTVDPMKKLKLMSVVQHYIDSSISITFNLPKTATVDDVYNIYYKAWEYGLKGITVYREGSRDGVLVTEANYKEKIHAISTDTRPKDVPCDIYFTKHKGKEFLILVGIVNGSPYEVFLTPIMGEIDHSYSKGIITKIKSGHYELCVQNGTRKILIDNIGAIFDPAYASLSRLVSVSLQHGASLDKIIAQLSKDGDLGAFQKVISRVLKQYVPDNTVSKTACPVCGAPLVYEGGCMICKSCGNSKCD